MESSSSFNELLINEVKAHPSLYDQHQRVCTDNGERNLIWEVIAQRIDKTINGDFAKKRWLQVRDRYRKELKMALRTSMQPKWPYFSKLNWLDPYLKDAKSIKNESNSPITPQSNKNFENGHLQSESHHIAHLSTDNSKEGQHLQFPHYQTVNLLEQLMAASRDLIEKHREKCATEMEQQPQIQSGITELFSSPAESAAASTSEENAAYIAEEVHLNDNNDDLQELFMNGKKSAEQQEDKISSLNKLINQRISQANEFSFTPPTSTSLDFNALLNSPKIANPFSIFPNPFQQMNSSLQHSNRFCRSRNQTPYLVRRGNKQHQIQQKSKSECNSSNSSPHKFGINDASSICSNNKIDNKNGNELIERLPTAEQWNLMDLDDDEDLLFARLVMARLKKFEGKKRREIRFAIHQLLDKSEEELEMMEAENGGEKEHPIQKE